MGHKHGDDHAGEQQVLIKFGGPDSHDTRTQWMPDAIAALWVNGGVDMAKFNALDVYGQNDAIRNSWTQDAILHNGDKVAIQAWIGSADASGYYSHTLPADFPPCPTTGMTSIVYCP